MLAFFSAPDAGLIGLLATAIFTAWNSRRAAKATRPNGGSSLRDVADRIEKAQKTMTVDIGDMKADIRDVKADVRDGHRRIAALEKKPRQ